MQHKISEQSSLLWNLIEHHKACIYVSGYVCMYVLHLVMKSCIIGSVKGGPELLEGSFNVAVL